MPSSSEKDGINLTTKNLIHTNTIHSFLLRMNKNGDFSTLVCISCITKHS